MLLLTLPGTPLSYYGEELGMINTHSAVSDGLLFQLLSVANNRPLTS